MFVTTSGTAAPPYIQRAARRLMQHPDQAAKALSGGGAMTDSSAQDLFVETFCDLPHAASLLPNMQGFQRGSSALAPPPVSKSLTITDAEVESA